MKSLPAVLLLWSVLAVQAYGVFAQTGGFTYALDDAYIHLAVAKNFVAHGVWGVTPYGFSSSTSSLSWPLLLAGSFSLTGACALVPLAWNAALATLLLVVTRRFLPAVPGRYLPLVVPVVLVACTGLATVVLTGLEHVLHTLLHLAFVWSVARALVARPGARPKARDLGVLVLASALVLTRFEGLAPVGLACVLALVRGRRRFAFALALAGALPVAGYAAISLGHGWNWLPNSVLLKGNSPELETLGRALYERLFRAPDLLFLLLGTSVLLLGRPRTSGGFWREERLIALFFMVCALFQLQFAKTGNLYRYDLFLVVHGLLVLVPAAWRWLEGRRPWRLFDPARLPQSVALAFVGLLLAVPFAGQRGVVAALHGVQACVNTNRQMVQMGRFLAEHYEGQPIAANDIGAISWLGDHRLFDLAGLASMEAATLRLANAYTPAAMDAVCVERGVRVAVAYPNWYAKPESWERVGTWDIGSGIGVADRRVAFYAVVPEARAALIANLRAFSAELPAAVRESGAYTRPDPR